MNIAALNAKKIRMPPARRRPSASCTSSRSVTVRPVFFLKRSIFSAPLKTKCLPRPSEATIIATRKILKSMSFPLDNNTLTSPVFLVKKIDPPSSRYESGLWRARPTLTSSSLSSACLPRR